MTYRIFQYRLPMEGQPDELNRWLAGQRIVQSYETGPGRGLPIGALSSQYLGNFMLDRWDRGMKKGGKASRYLRYMDDAVVWGRKEEMPELRECAKRELGALGLELKNGGEWNACSQGVPFLGFTIYPDRVRLNRNGRQRLRRKFGELERERKVGNLNDDELGQRAGSLFAHAAVADDVEWRREVLRLRNFGEGPGSGSARRVLEQYRQELPLGLPQQEQARQPQQEQRVSLGFGPRHGGVVSSPDVASSRALSSIDGAETTGKPSLAPETPFGDGRKGTGGAPKFEKGGADE